MLEEPRMQKWNEEPRLQGAATSWKQEDNQGDLQEDHRAGDHEESKRDVQWVSENKEMDLVERSAPSETKKEIVHGVRAGYVGTPATPGVIPPSVQRERERKEENFG
jgi:hypothetical protein